MTNVRGFSDLGSDDPNQNRNQNNTRAFPRQQNQGQRIGGPPNNQNPNQNQGRQPQMGNRMMMMGLGGDGDTPYPPLNKVLAPDFSIWTFMFWISVIQVLMFICELIVGQVKYGAAFVSGNDMAGPGTKTFIVMGAKYLPLIQKGEVFRFVTPALLHAGILHIFTNLVTQTIIGYTCELQWGLYRTICIYFATAFGATLLSCVGDACTVSVGASGALLGVIGAEMSWLLINWNNRELIQGHPCQRMCTMIIWLFIIFMIGISTKGIDNLAHLGGWMSGIMIGFSFHEYRPDNTGQSAVVGWLRGKEQFTRYLFMGLATIYFATTLFCSFFAVSTSDC